MRPSRSSDRPVRRLEWRVRIFGVGAVLGVMGIALEQTWLVTLALVVLVGGFFLRFVRLPQDRPRP